MHGVLGSEHEIVDKETAFKARPTDVVIPIDRSGMHFTRRWFVYRNQCTFSTHLPPKFVGSPVKMIQIGVFEGMDLAWQMQNVLTHPDSLAVGIDPWDATTKLDQKTMDEVRERAHSNLSRYGDKVKLIRGYSQKVLDDALLDGELFGVKTGQWDYIIIDGDHDKDPVLVDAENSLELVKIGGWLVFDDVRNRIPKKDHVKDALELFLRPDYHGDRVIHVWSHRFCDCYERIA